jgi:Tol biopolymer transport system component
MLSPDGKWVVAIRRIRPLFRVALLPTGVGEAKILTDDSISCNYASWFPDGKRILIVGVEPGHGARNYILDLAGAAPRPITPEGIAGKWLSPDGQWIIAGPISPEYQWYRTGSPEHQPSLFPVAEGKPLPIPGLSIEDEPIRWSGDGRSIYVRQREKETARVRVYRLELATGRRELWKEYVPDSSQTAGGIPLAMTPDGKTYAYTYIRNFSDLYLVKGLK